MGQALFYKRMHGLKQKIYRWKQYNVKTTYTYYWNRYNVVSTTTYKWDKYNRVSTTKYTWDKYKVVYTYTWDKWSTALVAVETEHNTPNTFTRQQASTDTSGEICYWSSHPRYSLVNDTWAFYEKPRSTLYYRSDGVWPTSKYNSSWFFTDMTTIGDSNICLTNITEIRNESYYLEWGGAYVYNVRVSGSKWYSVAKKTGKGTTSYGQVSSNISSTYPSGGVKDGYWYDNWTSTKSKGDYIGTVSSNSSSAYPSNGVFNADWYVSAGSSVEYSKGSTSYGQVTSTSSSAYPSNGYSGSYWYVSAGSTTSYSKGSTKYSDVSSTNSSAYPDNGKSGSYWYVYSRSTTSYSQGSYIGDKLSTNRNEYPDNAKSGSYWYVFDGEA